MTARIDNVFGIHADSLRLRAQRMEILARNIANADTPHYKARDIDFKAALQGAGVASLQLRRSEQRHLGGTPGLRAGAELEYRTPQLPALDGNTVEVDREQALYVRNTVRYLASLRFLNGRINGLRTAITGGQR